MQVPTSLPVRCEGAGIRSEIPAELPTRAQRLYSMLELGSGDTGTPPFVPLPAVLPEIELPGLTGPTP